ncbi:MAG: hypothetical protein ACI4HI_14030 [Lachnospiraceae bacterium]
MLVQISFELLHYPTLEEKCEENGEFVQDDEPDKRENQCIQILEQVIDQIYLKRTVLRKEGYFDALSTYVHESCHMFGGDASQAFSLGLTLAMELLLSHYSIVEKYKTEWEKLFGGN